MLGKEEVYDVWGCIFCVGYMYICDHVYDVCCILYVVFVVYMVYGMMYIVCLSDMGCL